MNIYSLAFQATYHGIDYALYNNALLVKDCFLSKNQACSLLMADLNTLLETEKITWHDITFIGASQGPAPFTTLRALIASINGISFATKIPLVGVDGLQAFLLQEHHTNSISVVLLNAFGNDVYFGIQKEKDSSTGYANGKTFLENLAATYPHETVHFAGNGITLWHTTITEFFSSRAVIASDAPEIVSLETVFKVANIEWSAKESGTNHLTPLYLKTINFPQAITK